VTSYDIGPLRVLVSERAVRAVDTQDFSGATWSAAETPAACAGPGGLLLELVHPRWESGGIVTCVSRKDRPLARGCPPEPAAERLGVGAECCAVLWAPMPEAAVDEQRHLDAGEDEIRAPSQSPQRRDVDAMAQITGMHQSVGP
jgi:hypothetical protein